MALLVALLFASPSQALENQHGVTPTDSKPVIFSSPTDFRPQITKLAEALSKEYYSPDIGKKYAGAIENNLSSGKYQGLSRHDLAKQLTSDLKAVAADMHLVVREEDKEAATSGPSSSTPPTIAESGWLKPGVAYIRFNWFSGQPDSVLAVKDFMHNHSGARVLIIDARDHRGGSLAEFNTIVGYLYSKPARMLTMDVSKRSVERQGSPFEDGPEMRRVNGPKGIIRYENWAVPNIDASRYVGTRVYYLISEHTGSAGEHMALALKTTKRAVLVGGTTVGAGHFGSFVSLGNGLEFDLPIGRTFDPRTGLDWEGVGVNPDIPVDPALALQTALALSER